MDLFILLYLLVVIAVSSAYHLKVQSLTKKRCVYLMSFLFSLKALLSFVYNCIFYKQQLIEFLSEETMIVCSLSAARCSFPASRRSVSGTTNNNAATTAFTGHGFICTSGHSFLRSKSHAF